MIEYRTGNVIDAALASDRNIILAHVVNDLGVMGAGVALEIANRWSWVCDEYVAFQTAHTSTGDLLGEIQFVDVEYPRLTVCNMFAQRGVRSASNRRPLDYLLLERCLRELGACTIESPDWEIWMPRIGCGLAGGEWSVVESLIDTTLGKLGVTTVVFDLEHASDLQDLMSQER